MRVYNTSFEYVYSITRFLRYQQVKKYQGASVLTVVIDSENSATHFLQKNHFIVTDDMEPFIIRNIEQGMEQVTITAYGLHALLNMRITGGGAIKNVEVAKSGSPDVVIKHFIDQCKGDLPIVTKATKSGTNITDQTRLKVLGDEVERICLGAGLGELFELDAANGRILFDTYAGEDKTGAVVFDLKFNNIASMNYSESAVGEQTTIYVGGADEGSNREMVIVGGDKTGFDRVERFQDARDIPKGETATLAERGAQSIIPTMATISTEARQGSGLVYGVDYFLGDIVTTRVKRKSYERDGNYFNPVDEILIVNQRITEVCITRENGAETIDMRFGESPITPTQLQSMQREIAQLKAAEPPAQEIPEPEERSIATVELSTTTLSSTSVWTPIPIAPGYVTTIGDKIIVDVANNRITVADGVNYVLITATAQVDPLGGAGTKHLRVTRSSSEVRSIYGYVTTAGRAMFSIISFLLPITSESSGLWLAGYGMSGDRFVYGMITVEAVG